MTSKQSKIHMRAKKIGQRHRQNEFAIIEVLHEVEHSKLHQTLACSVFRYAVEHMGLDEAVAYAAIDVARKAMSFPDLLGALREQRLTLSKAARITATLTSANAKALVSFASSHSKREIEREVARINPKASGKDKVRQLSEEFVEITLTLSRQDYENMKRAEDIHGASAAVTLGRVYEEHLERHDPIRKARRNAGKSELCPGRIGDLSAAETHAVNMRDGGQCTEIDKNGVRCPERRWLEKHHIIERSQGGTNDLDNLTTLCWRHHHLRHSGTPNLWRAV